MSAVCFDCRLVDVGYPRPYADTYREYEIRTDKSEQETLDFCRSELIRCSKSVDDDRFFADPYYEFSKVGSGVYRYRVTKPNCD